MSGSPAGGEQRGQHTEVVFSSSEDRIRASQASVAVARPSIASGKPTPPEVSSSEVIGTAGIRRFARQLAEGLFAVLFPCDCRICGAALVRISRLPVCQECLAALRPITEGVCNVCGERLFSPFATESDDPRCGMCQRIAPPFVRAVAYGSYEDELREMIHLLKYGGVYPAAKVLGQMLALAIAKLEPVFTAEPVVVVPVPLHRRKQRQRGFNQAELIARAALKLGGWQNGLRLCPRVLERKRETTSQTGLTRHQRRENLRGAFAVAQPERVKGREILLVDDVYTTGATLMECARVLRRVGAGKIWVATVARTLKISAQQAEIASNDFEVEMKEGMRAGEALTARAAGF